jgi:hypothetical protein
LSRSTRHKILIPQSLTDIPFSCGFSASDKCGTESECLSFSQHLSAGLELWDSTFGKSKSKRRDVVLTTESQQIANEQQLFASGSSSIRFITNHLDVTQDTGYFEVNFAAANNASQATPDAIMLSALSSLKLQLKSRVTLGNCCSNFHLLLKDLLSAGCGGSPENTFQCLQRHQNPAYRICCAWDKSVECQARRVENATLSTAA